LSAVIVFVDIVARADARLPPFAFAAAASAASDPAA
jgi:hypothetical protein